MFYATTIKSIGGGGAVDVQGRHLSFIGYLPVKEGDTVYTDGRYIFGNAPPKGAPTVFDTPGGIPVLGDEYSLSTSDPKGNLRGYVTAQGKYKKYNIAGDEWITNAKKTYAHDGSIDGIDDENIIDAEIALDENGAEDGVYTVEKIVEEVGEDKTNGMKYLRDEDDHIFGFSNAPEISSFGYFLKKDTKFTTRVRLLYLDNKDTDLAAKDDEQVKTCEITIYKDGQEKEKIDLDDFVAPIIETAKNYVAVNVVGRNPDDHLIKRIVVDNFKIKPNGQWELILTVEVVAERIFTAEPLILLRRGTYHKTVESQTVPTDEDFDEEKYGSLAPILKAYVSQFDALTRPQSITYTTYTFTVEELPPRQFSKEVANTFAHCVYTLKIKSDEGNPETLFENVFIAPLLFFDVCSKRIDDTGWKYTKSIPMSHGLLEPYDPYNDGWIYTMDFDREAMTSDVLEEFGILPDKGGNFTYPQIYDLGADFWAAGTSNYIGAMTWIGPGDEQRTYDLYIIYFDNIVMLYDSRKMLNAPDYENPVENIADDFSFPVQDEYRRIRQD